MTKRPALEFGALAIPSDDVNSHLLVYDVAIFALSRLKSGQCTPFSCPFPHFLFPKIKWAKQGQSQINGENTNRAEHGRLKQLGEGIAKPEKEDTHFYPQTPPQFYREPPRNIIVHLCSAQITAPSPFLSSPAAESPSILLLGTAPESSSGFWFPIRDKRKALESSISSCFFQHQILPENELRWDETSTD